MRRRRSVNSGRDFRRSSVTAGASRSGSHRRISPGGSWATTYRAGTGEAVDGDRLHHDDRAGRYGARRSSTAPSWVLRPSGRSRRSSPRTSTPMWPRKTRGRSPPKTIANHLGLLAGHVQGGVGGGGSSLREPARRGRAAARRSAGDERAGPRRRSPGCSPAYRAG